jgi:hypothetical protein
MDNELEVNSITVYKSKLGKGKIIQCGGLSTCV